MTEVDIDSRLGAGRTGYLGLGSNEDDRLAALRAARAALDRAARIEVAAVSSVYETAPQGAILNQPDFLNACVEIRTDLEPEQLLAVCKAIERELGRRRGGERHGARPIDVDLLLLGRLTQDGRLLTLPHGEIARRRFVLEPLLELDGDLTLPDGTPLASLVGDVADQPVSRLGPL